MFQNPLQVHGLVLPQERTTGLGCIPEGRSVSYQCTSTVDGGITLWIGSAFTCPAASIALIHSLFTQTGGVSDSCGGLTAMSVGVNGTVPLD